MRLTVYKQLFEFENNHWWVKGIRDLCITMLSKYCSGNHKYILDIGCGTGELSRPLERLGCVFSADSSVLALDFCKRRSLQRLIRTSAEHPGFKNNSFSVVVAASLIEHLEKDELFFEEMHRVLKKNGYLIILTSAFQFLWSRHDELSHHKRRYRLRFINELMRRNQFSIKKISYTNCFLFPAILLVRVLQKYFTFRGDSNRIFLLKSVRGQGSLNNIFYHILRVESQILKHINFPYGVNILCIGQKL